MPLLDSFSRSAPALTAELARMTQRLAPLDGDHDTALPDLKLHRRNEPTEPLHCIFPLGLALTVQGHKQVLLGDQVFAYGPGESMLTTIDLPVAARVVRATAREPYLGISLALDPSSLARVLTDVEAPRRLPGTRVTPLSVQRLDAPSLEALIRLLRLLDEPAMMRHLAPLIRQELLVRLLHGPHASHVAHLAAAGTPRRQVADVVTWLKQHFTEPVAVDHLAARANMSPSVFRQHFRAMTRMSPVQFQTAAAAGGPAVDADAGRQRGGRERARRLRECVPVQPRVSPSVRRPTTTRHPKRTDSVSASLCRNRRSAALRVPRPSETRLSPGGKCPRSNAASWHVAAPRGRKRQFTRDPPIALACPALLSITMLCIDSDERTDTMVASCLSPVERSPTSGSAASSACCCMACC